MNKLIPPLSLTQVAENLGISRPTLYQMVKDGRFDVPAVKGLHPRKWSAAAVENWKIATGWSVVE